ncbi:MAG: bifunctional DNA-formamidopyrimidine glycosylase/DNA-(apurinic or apyrimidinic site) lyase [Phycisphaerales bacterium]|nr:bifunctional DNA-formamidopyrimidine glycosylase/DNA-(apurinic or apyrimidinic site) lyase [Phycisphaerales bacterium]
MPELPEIEHLRRSLEQPLAGATIVRVDVLRADVVRTGPARPGGAPRRGRAAATALANQLGGARILDLDRRGKHLAIVTDAGVLDVHLGMSGQLFVVPGDSRASTGPASRHVHVRFRLRTRSGDHTLVFRDPRRFGGLWIVRDRAELNALCWSRLGPDALATTPGVLGEALSLVLSRRRRAVKAILLDQSLVAGIGNIYADEALFRAGVHPASPGGGLRSDDVQRLATEIHAVLGEAVRAGGSSIRDYRDGAGRPGSFARQHAVYGRKGLPCLRCGAQLSGLSIGGRTTVHCPGCQPRRRSIRSGRRPISAVQSARA